MVTHGMDEPNNFRCNAKYQNFDFSRIFYDCFKFVHVKKIRTIFK